MVDQLWYDFRMSRLRGALAAVLVTICALAAAASAAAASGCPATAPDGFGPFGRGSPPLRASIGKGHVLSGVILSALNCKPIPGARVELWQSNAKGRYVRATSGTVLADRSGRFRFEGPYPASYEGRPPHIHLRVVAPGHDVLLARYEPARGARRGTVRLVLQPQAV
jgi:protocatechuate 3,4-dioxygenase beta subunit